MGGYQVARLNRNDPPAEYGVLKMRFDGDIAGMLTLAEGLVVLGEGRTTCATCELSDTRSLSLPVDTGLHFGRQANA